MSRRSYRDRECPALEKWARMGRHARAVVAHGHLVSDGPSESENE